MDVPYPYVSEVLDLLEKAAAENDALAGEVASLKMQLVAARPVKQAAFSSDLLLQASAALVAEGLVPAGYDSTKTAFELESRPDRMLNLLIQLAAPHAAEGRPVKAALAQPLSGEPKLVEFNGKTFVDTDGWVAALTPTR